MEQLSQKIKPAVKLLKQYEMIVSRWQKALNLVSKNDIKNLWIRHILDSAQLYFYIPTEAKVLVDFGSGGGFPALVLAVLNKCLQGNLTDFYLIESDGRKCIFLQEAARELGVNVHIVNDRIENVNQLKADVITARGFAQIDRILQYGCSFLKNNTIYLLLKGEKVSQEIKDIEKFFHIVCSAGLNGSSVIQISGVQNND